MDCDQIERCKREIAAIEAEILAGNPDLPGFCLALSDWHAEWRILEQEARSQDEARPHEDSEQAGEAGGGAATAASCASLAYPSFTSLIPAEAECYGFDPEKGDPDWKAREPMVIQVDQHREPGWRTGRRYPRTRGIW